jgi:spore photoproduct lyase
MTAADYARKFSTIANQSFYRNLEPEARAYLCDLAFSHRLTLQEFRQLAEISRDLDMWREESLRTWWEARRAQTRLEGIALKKFMLRELHAHIDRLKSAPTRYPDQGIPRPKRRGGNRQLVEKSDKKIFGRCPVASARTVCCNLYTIDVVENCVFGCSYCSIQTFYDKNVVFDEDFAQKLAAIPIDPDRFIHIGTGQSSDSLIWGNQHGVLEALFAFAAEHPNALLEFKTKSDNIQYFLDNKTPRNVVCSWSMNTPTIIECEEHFTANLARRLAAARQVADRGVQVAFHFHPMIYYQGWEQEYREIALRIMKQFDPSEVSFISFGAVTFIKPVIKQIRSLGLPTKILQSHFAPDPHGKMSYPDDIKVRLFSAMYDAFTPWRESVFQYLCMEKASIWLQTFGYTYETNDAFEKALGLQTLGRPPTNKKEQTKGAVRT